MNGAAGIDNPAKNHARGRAGRALTVLSLVVLTAVGCAKNPSVEVGLAPQLAADRESAPSVTVHLVGVTDAELARLNAISMTDYWDPSDPAGQRHALVESKGVKVVRL